MAQTTTSVGMRQGKEGTQKLHAPCLPPQRRGFPLTGWRSLDTAPFEQTVAGPRRKRPRAQSMDHPLPPIRWRPRGALNTRRQPPSAIRAEAWLTTSAAQGCSKAAPMALGPSPVLAQQAVLRISHSQPASSSPRSDSLRRSSHSHSETKGSSCFSSTLLLWVPG